MKQAYMDHAAATPVRPEVAQSSVVFTLNSSNREEEFHHVLAHLPPAGEKLCSFSPVWRNKIAAGAGG